MLGSRLTKAKHCIAWALVLLSSSGQALAQKHMEKPASTSTSRTEQQQTIQTKTTFRNGRTLINTGVGFVLGNLFFTVNHNLDPGYAVRHYQTQSYLDGVPVDAITVDSNNDLAVIRIPPSLSLIHI